MKIKNFVLGATVLTTMFAFTVPMSFGACHKGCPVEALEKAPCGIECSKDKVMPCNSKCTKCNELQEDCNCPREITTGGAAPVCKKELNTKIQSYAYPNSIYGESNAAILGIPKNSALFTDNVKGTRGVYVQNTDCATGAAANILGDTCLDKVVPMDKCPCKDDGISVQSPTSVQVTKKIVEPFKYKGHMTGAATGLGVVYPDVPESHWAAPEINHLSDKCILEGYPDGYFKPNKSITRAEMASMVVKGYNLDGTPLTEEGNFCDVPKDYWAYEQINKGASNGMIAGLSDDIFKPEGNLTRAEAMTIMSKGLSCPMDCEKANQILSNYKDEASIPSWAREPMAKAIDNGVLKYNQHGNMLHPNKKITRAEVASMLQNMRIAGGYDSKIRTACNDKPTGKTYIQKETKVDIPTLELTMNDMINAKNANVGEQFAATTINAVTIGGETYPAGSRVNGKIIEVIRPTKDMPGAIKLSFDEIENCNGDKMPLPKQVLTATVDNSKSVNWFARGIKWPLTWTGAVVGNVGRTIGGIIVGASNAVEGTLDEFGTGSAELLTGQFKAAGRSYQDSLKTAIKAPIDVTRTAFSGTLGVFQTTRDEFAYLLDGDGFPLAQVNPKEKITIAFGE